MWGQILARDSACLSLVHLMVDDFNDFVVVDVFVWRCMSCGLEWGWK